MRKFKASSACDYQGMKIWLLLFNIIPLQGNAPLSPSLFELAYPFQIEVLFLVLQILVHCRYDAFIASKLCSTKIGFQFWEQIEVRRGHIRRLFGVGGEEGLRIRIQSQQTWQLATCEQAHCPARAERLESISAQTPQLCYIICTIYRATIISR